ncbi:hypothetical protein [Proteus terrae]|uniref:hypothetical protein n=1 Tax=Proteus terrae TaxID=1574161 RepID=UPI001C5F14CC|nr:hypothetical protein [Proteus terrae]
MEIFLIIVVILFFIVFFILYAKSKEAKKKEINDSLFFIRINLEHSNYSLTLFGAGVSLALLQSGYNKAEVFSYIALMSTAQNINYSNSNILLLTAISSRGVSLAKTIKLLYDSGKIRSEIYANDIAALSGLILINEDTDNWVKRVLYADPRANSGLIAELVGDDIDLIYEQIND